MSFINVSSSQMNPIYTDRLVQYNNSLTGLLLLQPQYDTSNKRNLFQALKLNTMIMNIHYKILKKIAYVGTTLVFFLNAIKFLGFYIKNSSF